MTNYTINTGDTLSKIAKSHNTTVQELARLNNINNVNSIFAGQNLTLPETQTSEKTYTLPEVVVTAKAPKKELLTSCTAINTIKPEEIKITPTKLSAQDLIDKFGGKLQQRVVNGQKHEIAIIKQGQEEHKFLVNEDGTIGESLVTISTFGKNKYITKTENDKNIKRYFPQGLPSDVDVEYAHKGNQYYPIFKQDGKLLSNDKLQALMVQ